MRIGLIIAASLVASCGSSGEDNSTVPQAETAQGVTPIANDADNGLGETEPVSDDAGTSNGVEVASGHPCMTQGTDRLQVAPIRAVGTEPFWAAQVEGRCVTYSNPENQKGVRIWTRYSQSRDGVAAWIGQYNGKAFEMRIRPEQGCSDGMSDERYPIAVALAVDGEERKGCAKPL